MGCQGLSRLSFGCGVHTYVPFSKKGNRKEEPYKGRLFRVQIRLVRSLGFGGFRVYRVCKVESSSKDLCAPNPLIKHPVRNPVKLNPTPRGDGRSVSNLSKSSFTALGPMEPSSSKKFTGFSVGGSGLKGLQCTATSACNEFVGLNLRGLR